MNPKLQAALVLVGVFALGSVTGGATVYYTAQHRMHNLFESSPNVARREAILGMLRRRVRLDRKQVDVARGILAAHEGEFTEIHRTIAPRMKALRKQVFSEVRAVLREDQLPDLDRLAAHLDKWAPPDTATSAPPPASPMPPPSASP